MKAADLDELLSAELATAPSVTGREIGDLLTRSAEARTAYVAGKAAGRRLARRLERADRDFAFNEGGEQALRGGEKCLPVPGSYDFDPADGAASFDDVERAA